MATTIKVSRPTRLAEDESLTTFEDWKNNLIFYLSQDADFQLFLKSDTAWTVKSSTTEHRGLDSAAKCQKLEQFLGIIASLAPPLLYGDIIEDSTKLSDVFRLLRTYYSFAPSESTFLKFASIKREVENGTLERPLHLYLRMRQFIRDNLLLSSGKIQHDGKVPTADEKLSPTTERMIVLRWLQILHPSLPGHVANVFAHDLQTKSLKDLQPRIAEQINDLLSQIDHKECVDVSFSRIGNKRDSYRTDNYRPAFNQHRRSQSDHRYSDTFRKGGNRKPSTNQNVKKCQACKSVGEPFIGHSLYNCPNVLEKDRAGLIKSFSLEIEDAFPEDNDHVYEEVENDDCVQPIPINETDVRRVDIIESPKFNVKLRNTFVTMVLDTGATGSMISYELCKLANLEVLPSSHSAVQADGDSRLMVLGEVHTSILMDGLELSLNAVVVSKLKAGLIVGMAFMKEHDVIIDISNNFLLIHGKKIVFSNQPGNPKISLLRMDVNRVVLPGDDFEVPIPANFLPDNEIAMEPRDSDNWFRPEITHPVEGFVSITNSSDFPVKIKKHQVIGHVRSVVLPTESHSSTNPTLKFDSSEHLDHTTKIRTNPDNILSDQETKSFRLINSKYKSVFNSVNGVYNGKSGDVKASVILGENIPSPRKGKVPSYSSDKAKILQDKFDELVHQGVLSRPEEVGITVTHTSPSFLVKKPDQSFRLVTSFVELNKYICSLPTKMSTTEDVITSLGKWKHIIKTDLKSAYFQIDMCPSSQK